MKRLLKMIFILSILVTLTACGETKEEKEQTQTLFCEGGIEGIKENYYFTYNQEGNEIKKVTYKIINKVDLESTTVEKTMEEMKSSICEGQNDETCKVTSNNNNEVILELNIPASEIDGMPFQKNTNINDIEKSLNENDNVTGLTYTCKVQ